jgi:hypothetical protein
MNKTFLENMQDIYLWVIGNPNNIVNGCGKSYQETHNNIKFFLARAGLVEATATTT